MAINTSTHAVLENALILNNIIWLLHGNCYCHGPPDKWVVFTVMLPGCSVRHTRDLARCILVSKSWSRVAIPQLWKYFTRIENLVSLMANVPSTPSWYKAYYRNPPLVPARSKSWIFYSRYVQRLLVEPDRRQFDTPLLFLKVAPLIGDARLFPNLSSICLRGRWLSCDYSVPVLACLISSSLRQMRISFECQPTAEILRGMAQVIAERAHNLVYLKISSCEHVLQEDLTTNITSMLSALGGLCTISLPAGWASPELIESLSSLPHLQKIDLGDEDYFDLSAGSSLTCFTEKISSNPTPSAQMYPSLQILYLDAKSSELLKLLERAFTQVHILPFASIFFKDSPSESVTALISRFLPYIQHLYLNAGYRSADHIPGEPLRPLTKCVNLVELVVDGVILTSDELRVLIKAWPNLELLTLIGPRPRRLFEDFEDNFKEIPRAEMGGLDVISIGYVAETLLRLKQLRITVNASSTKNLGLTLRRFNLGFESLVLSLSFLNFNAAGFQSYQAARYISALLWPQTNFSLGNACDFDDVLNDENVLWDTYIESYRKFAGRFKESVVDYVRIRQDEDKRIVLLGGAIPGMVNGSLHLFNSEKMVCCKK